MRISIIDVTAERPYQVVVGTGAMEFLPQYLADTRRIAVIHAPVMRDSAARLVRGLPRPNSQRPEPLCSAAGTPWLRPASPAAMR